MGLDLESFLAKKKGGRPRPPTAPRRSPGGSSRDAPAGIMDWTKKPRMVAAVVLFVIFGLFSPVLGALFAFAVFCGLAVKVDAYVDDRRGSLDFDDRKLRMLRFFDAFAAAVPLAFRKRHVPTESYSPQPGKLVALLGSGTSKPRDSNDGMPFLKLRWWPPRRLSFWVAVGVGVICGVVCYLGADWVVGTSWAQDKKWLEGLKSVALLWTAGSAVGGFLWAAAIAEAKRWASQTLNVSDEPDEEPVKHPGYVCAFVSMKYLKCLLPRSLNTLKKQLEEDDSGKDGDGKQKKPAKGKSKKKNKKPGGDIQAPGFNPGTILFFAGMSAVSACSALIYAAPFIGKEIAEILPFAITVGLASGLLGGAKSYAHMLRKEMTRAYETIQEQIKNWNSVFDQVMPDSNIVPLWQSTYTLPCETKKDHVFVATFSIDKSDIDQFIAQCSSSRMVVALGNAAGVAVEGGENAGKDKITGKDKIRLVPSGNCTFLLVYYTPSQALGSLTNLPHLKPWEENREEPLDQVASHGGMLALRLALADALTKASMPAMMIVSAKQHHVVSAFDKDSVLWEIECQYRGKPMTDYQLNQKIDTLRKALKCEWLGVGAGSDAGQVVFWMSNTKPEDAVLKDEVRVSVPKSLSGKEGAEEPEQKASLVKLEEKELHPIPGGAETKGASPTRLKLIESQWLTLISQSVKDLPDNFKLLEQKCWSSDAASEVLAEATFNTTFDKNTALEKALSSSLDASWLYIQQDEQERTARISWAQNINPKAYLSPTQAEHVRKEAVINAVLNFWQPSRAKSNVVAVLDARFHKYTKDNGDQGEVIEVVCDKGASSPLEEYDKGYILRSGGNLECEWIRVGQTFGGESKNTFSIAFSADPEPDISTETELGQWVYALGLTWAYSLSVPELFGMRMTEFVPLTSDNSLVRSRWVLPAGYDFASLAEQTSKLDRLHGCKIMIPGTMKEDLHGVYLVAGERIPADESEWLEISEAEQVAKWNWERMMLICRIQTHDQQVPTLLDTKIVGRTMSHTVELPSGMGGDEITKNNEKIQSTGNYFYLEIRPQPGNKVVATTSHEDPLESMVTLPEMRPRPDSWNMIPLGVGIHLQSESDVSPGYSPFTVCWKVSEAPHMLLAGTTGSGKTSVMRVIAAEAISRGWDVVIIDAIKMGADFAGIKEYDLFCSQAAFTLDTAWMLIKKIYEEVRRRVRDNTRLDVGNWYDRPAGQKPRPVLLMVDEAFSMLVKDEGQDEESKERNKKKAEMLTTLGKIAREARSAGVHLLLVAQRPDAAVMKGEMKQNLGANLLLGKANHIARDMMFQDTSSIPPLDASNVVRGRGVFEQTGSESCLVQTFWAGTSEETTENLRRMYSRLLKRDVQLKKVR